MHDKAVSKACTAYIDTDTMDQAVSMRAAIRAFLASAEISASMDDAGESASCTSRECECRPKEIYRAMSAKLADELEEK